MNHLILNFDTILGVSFQMVKRLVDNRRNGTVTDQMPMVRDLEKEVRMMRKLKPKCNLIHEVKDGIFGDQYFAVNETVDEG